MEGITYIENFVENPEDLFQYLLENVTWDERMNSRKTASFGQAYNYSQISYPYQEVPKELSIVMDMIREELGYMPNNCLINYYIDGKSKMGFHSDQTDILDPETGVSIISLGETRALRFRNIIDQGKTYDFMLPSGSFIHMENEVQDKCSTRYQSLIPI